MRIGQLAKESGVTVPTLRFYEQRGLLAKPRRLASGYREYANDTVATVRFVRRAQHLGFTLEEVRDLLRYWSDSSRSCGAVEKRARETLQRIDAKMAGLEQMREALTQYVTACRTRTTMQDCPLLSSLGGPEDNTGG